MFIIILQYNNCSISIVYLDLSSSGSCIQYTKASLKEYIKIISTVIKCRKYSIEHLKFDFIISPMNEQFYLCKKKTFVMKL